MRRLAVIVLLAAVMLSACGGGGGATGTKKAGGTTSPQAATPAPPPVTLPGTVNNKGTRAGGDDVEIKAEDFFFEPTFVRGEPGKAVIVTVKNEGKIQHTFTIDGIGVDEVISPLDRKEIRVTLPPRGNLNYYCRFHRSQGMQGAFFIP